MSGRRLFLDSNILVYLFDQDVPEKQNVARQLLLTYDRLLLSTQVLQEFYVVATRKLARPLAPRRAAEVVDTLLEHDVVQITPTLLRRAIDRSIDSQLSYWDSVIVEAALACEAEFLLSEDMQHGWRIGSMTVWNPFISPDFS
jgi:predicted nucleic acid-binding protein